MPIYLYIIYIWHCVTAKDALCSVQRQTLNLGRFWKDPHGLLVFFLGSASDDHIIKIWEQLLQFVHKGCIVSLECRYSVCETKGKSGELKKTSVYVEHSGWHVLAMEFDLMICRLQIDFRKQQCSQLLDQASRTYLGMETHPWTYDYLLSANSQSPSVASDCLKQQGLCPPGRV